jgi:hypothetical protein
MGLKIESAHIKYLYFLILPDCPENNQGVDRQVPEVWELQDEYPGTANHGDPATSHIYITYFFISHFFFIIISTFLF